MTPEAERIALKIYHRFEQGLCKDPLVEAEGAIIEARSQGRFKGYTVTEAVDEVLKAMSGLKWRNRR